ncbi:MAG: HlyD family efflux transporter periplasmic adaptor subunit [Pseudomonadota bacterium]
MRGAQAQSEGVRLPQGIRRLVQLGGVAVAGFLVFVGVWSSTAHITTTLRLPGVLSPEAPSYEVQHDSGGRVSELHVELHEEVAPGDLLFMLDVSDEVTQLNALKEREVLLSAELAAIAPRLEVAPEREVVVESVRMAYAAQDTAFSARLAQLDGEAAGIESRRAVLVARRAAQAAQVALSRDQFERELELSGKGLIPVARFEASARDLHDGEAALLALRAEDIDLAQRADDVALRRSLVAEERRERLATTRLRQERDLIDTRARIARLEETVARAEIRAPVAGKVTQLPIVTTGMVAAPGMTLAVLSQAVREPLIDLYVPPSYIDQVREGQDGLLTIPALPQRSAPMLRVTITDLAREPLRDPEGNSIHYLARAKVHDEDVAAAEAKLGERFQLSVGMPVNAAMNGRDTTLWEFVAGPFTGLLGAAFED